MTKQQFTTLSCTPKLGFKISHLPAVLLTTQANDAHIKQPGRILAEGASA